MSYKNKYPFVFLGGMLSWGEENIMYKGWPYWGMVAGNLCRQLRETNIEAYGVQVGPANSAWDRGMTATAAPMKSPSSKAGASPWQTAASKKSTCWATASAAPPCVCWQSS